MNHWNIPQYVYYCHRAADLRIMLVILLSSSHQVIFTNYSTVRCHGTMSIVVLYASVAAELNDTQQGLTVHVTIGTLLLYIHQLIL